MLSELQKCDINESDEGTDVDNLDKVMFRDSNKTVHFIFNMVPDRSTGINILFYYLCIIYIYIA